MPPNTICPPDVKFDALTYENNGLLQDPYSDTVGKVSRFAADVPEEILLKFKAIMPYRGAIQATINTILYGLLKEFEKNGIKNYDPVYRPKIVEIIKSRAFGEMKLQGDNVEL